MELHCSSLERMGRLDMNFLKVAVSIIGAVRERGVDSSVLSVGRKNF